MDGTESSIEPERIDEFHQRGRELLRRQAEALDRLIHDLHERDPRKTIHEIRTPLLMLQAIGVSVHSILALTATRDMAIRDSFGIARSITETAINAAYISTGGRAVAERAHRHMRQKRWRDLKRHGRIGPWAINVERHVDITATDIPGLASDLDEFTNKRGKEVRDWTDLSLEERIEAIGQWSHKASLALGVALFAIYRTSSEMLHGTYYGVQHFWQGSRSKPALTHEAFDDLWLADHFVTILTAVFFAVNGAITAISETNSAPEHQETQNKLANDLRTLIDDLGSPESDADHSFALK